MSDAVLEEPRETEGPQESLASGYSGRVFLAIAVGWVGLRLGQGVLPPLLPAIIDDLAITPFLAGLALTTMTGINAICQFLGGRSADALTRKTVIAASLGAMTLGLLALTGAVVYPLFLLGVGIFGVGAGLFFVPMRAALADLFVEKRGRAFGINEAAGSAASVAAAGLAVVALSLGGWRLAVIPGIAVLLIGLVVLHRWHREPYTVEGIDLELRETVASVLGTREVRWLLAAYSLETFALMGMFNFLPTFLHAERGFSTALASGSYALISVMGMIAMPIAGGLSDRADRTAVATGSLLVGSVGLIAVVSAPSTPLILLSIALFAGGILGFPPVMQAHMMDHFPDESMGRDFGGFKTGYFGFASLGPTYVGFVAERASYGTAFLGLVACLLASAAIIVWITRIRPQSRPA